MKKKIRNSIGIGIIVIGIIATLVFMNTTTKLSGQAFLETYKSTPDAVLIDVRTPPEFSSGHIDTAINIDLSAPSFISDIQKLDPSKSYFVYCRSGSRSDYARELMKAQGIEKVYDLRGGIISHALPLVPTL